MKEMIWGNLIQLSFNMWEDRVAPERPTRYYRPELRFDEPLWRDLLQQMAAAGMNMVVIDLGDGVRYKSHPEIAVKNAWSPAKLRQEIARARDLGLEPIPKMNFSASHDTWLGEYSRCLSTPRYYQVCRDLIAEAIELFDKPRFFHLGMDEETPRHQRYYGMAIIRQHELWWHDLMLYVKAVEDGGVRPWIWADFIWHHREDFLQKMPRSVLQSNWYYDMKFEAETEEAQRSWVDAYRVLEQTGYDQVPTGSNVCDAQNFPRTVEYCRKIIDPSRLFGFLQSTWQPTTEEYRAKHKEAIEVVAQARRAMMA